MTPLGDQETKGTATLENASYADVIKYMTYGFGIRFPFRIQTSFMGCLMGYMP
jgi:hypothetical protein